MEDEREPFRVLLDFTELNTGMPFLKYVWMHISPRELQTIYDFKQAIIKKFSFSRQDFNLFIRGGLLLETEKIFVLREDDTVRLLLDTTNEQSIESRIEGQMPQSMMSLSVSRTGDRTNLLPSNSAVSSAISHKRKSETFTNSDSSSSKKRKKQKKPHSSSSELYNNSQPIKEVPVKPTDLQDESSDKIFKPSTSNDNQVQMTKNIEQPKKNKKKSCYQTPTSDFIARAVKLSKSENTNHSQDVVIPDFSFERTVISKANVSSIFEQTSNEISTNKTEISEEGNRSEIESNAGKSLNGKKRRRRRRKRKENSLAEDSFMSGETTTEMETETSNLSSAVSNQTFNTPSVARKHVIYQSPSKFSEFDDSVTQNESNNVPGSNSSKKKSLAKDLDDPLHRGWESSAIKLVDCPTESTPLPKKKLNGQPWGVTPLPKISNGASNTFSMKEVDSSKNETFPKLLYKDCIPLNCVPAVGTHLIFKTLELTEDYQPEVTEYKEGILKKFDPKTDELEIELIKEEVKPGRLGKFENVWEDEEPPANQVIKTVSLNWTALIEPRLLDR